MSERPVTDGRVLVRREGALGHITLDRPRALNAFTFEMMRAVDRALRAWRGDPAVRAILIDGAGERGLCAGGDIRAIYEAALAGDPMPKRLWREEYRLNALIARYPKPYVALMDGLVLGGGVGLSAHGSLRIVTERSQVAMPEVAIGLSPDVGATHLLARAPGELGAHAALTGARLGAADAILCGLADRFLPAQALPSFVAALAAGEPEAALVAAAPGDSAPPRGALAAARPWIDACYAAPDVEEILDRLAGRPEPGAAEAGREIATKSPTAVKVALRALRRARQLGSLEACLDQDFRISCAIYDAAGDLVEGIRAAVIDKDRNPRWSPASLEQVTPEMVARHFRPLGDQELGLAA